MSDLEEKLGLFNKAQGLRDYIGDDIDKSMYYYSNDSYDYDYDSYTEEDSSDLCFVHLETIPTLSEAISKEEFVDLVVERIECESNLSEEKRNCTEAIAEIAFDTIEILEVAAYHSSDYIESDEYLSIYTALIIEYLADNMFELYYKDWTD